LTLLRWVIVGGEQHPGHRVMEEDWAYALRDQCKRNGIPFFMKQMTTGRLRLDLQFREFPKV
jgi:protein gp37